MIRTWITVAATGLAVACGEAEPPRETVPPAQSQLEPDRRPRPSVGTADSVPEIVPAVAPDIVEPPSTPRPVIDSTPPAPVAVAVEVQDEGAVILRRVQQVYEGVRGMQADFTLETRNPLRRSARTSRGVLYQRSPDRLLLRFSDPEGDLVLSDGTNFWAYYPSEDRTQVNCAPASRAAGGGVDLRAQFVGDPVQRFRYTLEGREPVAGRPTHVLTLVPRGEAQYEQLKVWVDTQDALIRQFEIRESSGVERRFHFTDLALNPALSDTLFRFTPPAGTQVIGCN